MATRPQTIPALRAPLGPSRAVSGGAIGRRVAGGPLHVALDASAHKNLRLLACGRHDGPGPQGQAGAAAHPGAGSATFRPSARRPDGIELANADRPAPARISMNAFQRALDGHIAAGQTQVLFRRQGHTFALEAHAPNVPLSKKDLWAELNIIRPDNRGYRVYEFYAHEAGASYLCAQTAEIRTLAAKGRILLPPGSQIIIGNETLILPEFELSLTDHVRQAQKDGHTEINFGNGPFYTVTLPFSGTARELFHLSWHPETLKGCYRLKISNAAAAHILLIKKNNDAGFNPVKPGTTEILLFPDDQLRFDSQGDVLTLPPVHSEASAPIESGPLPGGATGETTFARLAFGRAAATPTATKAGQNGSPRPEAPLNEFDLLGED